MRVRDAVEWDVQPPTPSVRIGRAILGLLDVVSAAASSASASYGGQPRLPLDPDDKVPVDPLFISGRAPWMPADWAGRQLVEMTSVRATINPAGMESTARELPLDDLRIARARPRHRSRRPKHPTASWVVELTDGEHTLTLTGPWLSVAWLGHLARWPEP